jgi:hypothetical protein
LRYRAKIRYSPRGREAFGEADRSSTRFDSRTSSSVMPCPLLGRDINIFARRQRSQHRDAHHKRCYFSIYIDNGHSYLLFQTQAGMHGGCLSSRACADAPDEGDLISEMPVPAAPGASAMARPTPTICNVSPDALFGNFTRLTTFGRYGLVTSTIVKPSTEACWMYRYCLLPCPCRKIWLWPAASGQPQSPNRPASQAYVLR